MSRSLWIPMCLVIALAACEPDVKPEPAPTSSERAALSASARASAATAPSASAKTGSTDAEAKAKVEKELRELAGDADLPDADPSAAPLSPTDDNVAALLVGGQALTSLPVRSTDQGQSFDRDLPQKLKPPPAPAKPGRPGPKCPPGDPLCFDY